MLRKQLLKRAATLAVALTCIISGALAGVGFRLVVAGSVSRAVAGRREPWLAVYGEAPDLLPALHAADAGLNPVTSGGGSNVKLPTYLAAGLAVVTTPHGLRGFAPLAPWVVVARPGETAEALRARPAGWLARGLAPPGEVAGYAWGRLGERLGEVLEGLRSGGAVTAGNAEARAAEGGAGA